MTTRKRTTAAKGEAKKMRLKKETIRDLDVKKGKNIKGGVNFTILQKTCLICVTK